MFNLLPDAVPAPSKPPSLEGVAKSDTVDTFSDIDDLEDNLFRKADRGIGENRAFNIRSILKLFH